MAEMPEETIVDVIDHAGRPWVVTARPFGNQLIVNFLCRSAARRNKVLDQTSVWREEGWELSRRWLPQSPRPVPERILQLVEIRLKELMRIQKLQAPAWLAQNPPAPAPVADHFPDTTKMVPAATREAEPPTPEAAAAMGAHGGPPSEAERLAFEAWMRGHSWSVAGVWSDEIESCFRAWWSDQFGSAYFGAIPLVACIEWTQIVLARWGCAALQPVAVSERPWERPGWLDAKELCWVFAGGWVRDYPQNFSHTVCLPHWALPVPAADKGEGKP
jgi:hypothetical protein